MKKLIYCTALLLFACVFTSCSDDDDDTEFNLREWSYDKPCVQLDFNTDELVLGTEGHQKVVATDYLEETLYGLADVKMTSYFKGIEFKSDNRLVIHAEKKDGTKLDLEAAYLARNGLMEIRIVLPGSSSVHIPTISLRYEHSGNGLKLYMDETYFQSLFAVMGNRILPLVAGKLVPSFDSLPEIAKQAIIATLKIQISNIIDKNIEDLELGFYLR